MLADKFSFEELTAFCSLVDMGDVNLTAKEYTLSFKVRKGFATIQKSAQFLDENNQPYKDVVFSLTLSVPDMKELLSKEVNVLALDKLQETVDSETKSALEDLMNKIGKCVQSSSSFNEADSTFYDENVTKK